MTVDATTDESCFLCQKWFRPDQLNADGFCVECVDVYKHFRHQLKQKGSARIRTKQRTPEAAERMFKVIAQNMGVSRNIRFERGDTWVKAHLESGWVMDDVETIEPIKRGRYDGFVLADLDLGKLQVDLVNQRQRVAIMTQMATVDPLSVQRLPDEQATLVTLEKLVEEKKKWLAAKK